MAERPPVGNRRPETASLPAPALTGGMAAAPYVEVANNNLSGLDGSVAIPDGQGGVRIVTPQELAGQHEQSLKPLTYGQPAGDAGAVPAASSGVVPAAATGVQDAQTKQVRPAGRRIAGQPAPAVQATGVKPRPPVQAAPNQPDQAAVQAAATAPRPTLTPQGADLATAARAIGAQQQRSTHPAASNTDSPSRGIPRPISDPNKQITGGFGDAGDAQYYPLDGAELLQVVWGLMDGLAQRLVNDLRFSVAATYPRVAVRVQVVVEGYTVDVPIVIEKVALPWDKTPIEVAEKLGEEVVFVVRERRREFASDGTVETPPNAMRAEVGAEIPRKQYVGTGNNRSVVDRVG